MAATSSGHYIAELKTKITKDADKYFQDVVTDLYKAIISYSPTPEKGAPRSKGSFVQSNRIGIGGAGITTTKVAHGKDYNSEQNALGELNGVEKIQIGDTVIISNSLPYAHKVEYAGWPGAKSSTGPYYPYKLAEGKIKQDYQL